MAKKPQQVISTNQMATVDVAAPDTIVILNAGVSINANGDDGISDALGGGMDRVEYRIFGTIQSVNPASEAGMNLYGDRVRVTVAEGALVDAAYGIAADGTATRIVNHGTVTGASSSALLFTGNNFSLVNTGVINGDFTATRAVIVAGGDKGRIVNGKDGTMLASVTDQTFDGTATTIINNGTFTKSTFWDYAADLGAGNDRVVNTGAITGILRMGEGNDVIVSAKGNVSGRLEGGAGNDRFTVSGQAMEVYELAGGGKDTVLTSGSYSLLALTEGEIEILKAIGRKKADLVGSDEANRIIGNKGANHIDGDLGNDIVTGGKGRDVFYFEDGRGHDTVTDFVDGQDRFEVGQWTGVDDFGDIKAMMKVKGKDIWIDSGADQLIIENTSKAELDAKDFIF